MTRLWYTIKEAAEALGVSRGTLERGIRAGTVPHAGRWVLSYPCPDGEVRVFTAAPDGKPSRSAMRRPMAAETRFAVLKRDGYRCRYCGRGADSVELHVDHIVPVASGGSDDQSNLAAACIDCNLGKSDGEA